MADPTLNYVPCADANGGHRMAYWQWGAPDAAHTIVCVHGLSRQGRDFDVLAQALLARSPQPLRVVCPDVAGRGKSDWLKDPLGYQIPTYAADMLALLTLLKPATLDWVGTSMGGLIGMAVCAHAQAVGTSVRRLVLNDVGPSIQWEALARISTYLGKAPTFDSLQQAADAMWAISQSFGPHTPAQWLELSRHMVKTSPEGRVALHYDPAIAVPFGAVTQEMAAQGESQLWQLYDSLTAQTLLVRGAHSDLLSPATAQAMAQRGPRAQLVEFAGVGHAPTLIAPDQVDAVTSFLLG
ncbi:alpha/beta hydrolase [Rhodoferax sp.]|uniref:alpha/beta fold hydrolase n=1 Tax=Rhodoferax sp. TaxID=50421 RepID=UPI002ACDA0F8|nr:alpha/beta hydrolase [Rhodoferax sp.]MDZ7918745.1 alpha/beta hydrolase [Rhodoferax sp.]